ncbi:MAG: DUF1972 domain-containing protein [Phycisphaerae bacterium]|jgi:glycosyltransferase involved in cell wall biosynthesis|nr:DUF1972 domain-containing protein [Phycisphaerae bacterium]
MTYRLSILGTRGVPACHGGFESFAERLALFLVERGWKVSVYCQEHGGGAIHDSDWRGVRRIHVPVTGEGAAATVIFDWKTARHAAAQDGLFLTLGYNTALFNLWQRVRGQINLINMDGIEWRRDKWGPIARAWFWLNERAGCQIGNHLIADHPGIAAHLATRTRTDRITMIPYGADAISQADSAPLAAYGLEPGRFSVIIARPEPENSFLEMVRAFSGRRRGHTLVVLGRFTAHTRPYHREVMAAASAEVIFPGAIYEAPIVQALRFHSRLYLHGHRVGGTNPSLVEALGAQCAVVAHDNPFNRWVAGPGAAYFGDEAGCARVLDTLLDNDEALARMRRASYARFRERFTWPLVLGDYEALLSRWHPPL